MYWDACIPAGRVFGIPLKISVLFFVFLGLQVLFGFINGPWWALFWFILLGPILLFTVLIHELGHCLAARSVGSEVHSILIWPLGGLAFIGQSPTPKADMWVAFAGPLTHVPMTILWLIIYVPVYHAMHGTFRITLDLPDPEYSLGEAVLAGAIWLNIMLVAFNLLVPAYPLDGGRILADSLLWCGMEESLAAKVTVGVATPLGLGVVVWGIWSEAAITVMVGLFILFKTYELFEFIRRGEVQQHPMFAYGKRENMYNTYGASDGPYSRA